MRADGNVFTPYSCLPFAIRAGGDAATDVDHVVALAEAHDSGIAAGDREAIAADIDNLTIADPTVNRRRKGDRDAGEWEPDRHGAWFAAKVIRVKARYGLSVDAGERDALDRLLAGGGAELRCVAAVPAAPVAGLAMLAALLAAAGLRRLNGRSRRPSAFRPGPDR